MDNITKTRTIPAVFNEIIGKQIADIYGLICPEVSTECQTDGTYNITSLNLNITGTFMMPCYHKDIASLYDVWNYLEDKSLLRPELINDFIKMYTMDVIFGNPDRSPDNWGFLKINNVPYLVVFDNELLFSESHPSYINCSFEDDSLSKSSDDDLDFIIAEKLQEVEKFFLTSSEEYIDLFIEYFRRIDHEKFKTILDEAERELGLKDPRRAKKEQYFNKTYEGITNLIKKYRPVRSKENGA